MRHILTHFCSGLWCSYKANKLYKPSKTAQWYSLPIKLVDIISQPVYNKAQTYRTNSNIHHNSTKRKESGNQWLVLRNPGSPTSSPNCGHPLRGSDRTGLGVLVKCPTSAPQGRLSLLTELVKQQQTASTDTLWQHMVGGKNNIHIYINIFSQAFSVEKKVVVHWNRLGLWKAPLTGTLSRQTCSPYTGSWQALAQSMLARASGWAASRTLPHDIWSHVTRVQASKFPLLLCTGSFQERTGWSARSHRDHNHPRGCWTLPGLWTLRALSGSPSPNKAGLLQTQRLSPGFGEAPEPTSSLCSVRSAWARPELHTPVFTQLLAGKGSVSPALREAITITSLSTTHIENNFFHPSCRKRSIFSREAASPSQQLESHNSPRTLLQAKGGAQCAGNTATQQLQHGPTGRNELWLLLLRNAGSAHLLAMSHYPWKTNPGQRCSFTTWLAYSCHLCFLICPGSFFNVHINNFQKNWSASSCCQTPGRWPALASPAMGCTEHTQAVLAPSAAAFQQQQRGTQQTRAACSCLHGWSATARLRQVASRPPPGRPRQELQLGTETFDLLVRGRHLHFVSVKQTSIRNVVSTRLASCECKPHANESCSNSN